LKKEEYKGEFIINNLQIFKNEQFGEVRAINKEGQSWFVAKDISDILGYSETNRMTSRLDEDESISTRLVGMNMNSTLINESGLYNAVLGSKKVEAKQFKKWVTSEVLPTIRKTGGYIPIDENMSDTDIMAKAFLIANKTIDMKNKQLEEQKPKVLFAEAVSASHTSILVGDMAKLLKQNGHDVGANRLFKQLRETGYLICRKGTDYNMPTQKSMELGLFQIKETSIVHSDGHIGINKTPKVTGKGQIYFIDKYLKKVDKK